MKHILYILLSLSSLTVTAQELPYKLIKKTSFHRDEPTPSTLTELPTIGVATARGASGSDLGITPSNLDVSATGAAVYTIPIAVPAGINGVQPNLALTYNSQSGNGIAGYGWNITGISKITRVGSTPYHNGQLTGVNLTETDQFALDGQRLLLKEGTHGADGAVYEIENFSNVKVVAKGTFGNGIFGPSYFEVLYPDGSKAYYGKNNGRRPYEYNISLWENAQGVSIQYAYKTLDGHHIPLIENITYGAKGEAMANCMVHFEYNNRSRSETFYIGGIEFNSLYKLSAISVSSNGKEYRKYDLSYNANSLGYDRLETVQESAAGENRVPIGLQYLNFSDKLSKSTAKASTGFINVSLTNSAIVPLDYNRDGRLDFIIYPTTGSKAYKDISVVYNFRGEQNSLGVSFITNEPFKEIFPAKVLSRSGELLTNSGIVTTHFTTDKIRFDVYTDEYMGYPAVHYSKEWKLPAYIEADYNYCMNQLMYSGERPILPPPQKANTNIKILSGDFDGNGLTDVISIELPYNVEKCIPTGRRRKGGYCDCKHTIINKSTVNWIDLDRRKTSNYTKYLRILESKIDSDDLLQAIDMNGNGKTNLLHITKGKLFIYEMDGNYNLNLLVKHTNPYLLIRRKHPLIDNINSNLDLIRPIIGDFNGDGLLDFMLPRDNPTNQYDILYNTGKGFVTETKILPFKYEAHMANGRRPVQSTPIAIDMNNDGKSDIVEYRTAFDSDLINQMFRGISVFKNINGKDANELFVKINNSEYESYNVGRAGHLLFSPPDKRNMFMDIALIYGDTMESYSLEQDNKKEIILQAISKGEESHQITYNSMVSQKDEGFPTYLKEQYKLKEYPYADIEAIPTLSLVSKIERKYYQQTTEKIFDYFAAVTHLQGLGFLGFKAIMQTNWYEPSKKESQYLYSYKTQNYELRGVLTDEYITPYRVRYFMDYNPDFDAVSTVHYSYSHSEAPNKCFKLQLDKQVTEDKLKGITTTQSFAYDTDLNPTQITTETDGYRQVQELQYAPKESSPYRMGLLTHKRTASTLDGDTFTAEESYTYENGLVSTAKTKGNDTGERTEKFQYDTYGNITQKEVIAEDGQKRSEQYTYDPTHRFIATHTDFEGLKTSFVYDERGNLSKETTPWGQSTSYQYDIWNRPIKVTDYLGKSLHTTYGANGSKYNIRSDSDDDSYTSETYNALGWLLESEASTALGATAVRYEYDALGRTIGKSEPFAAGGSPQGWTRTEYDRYGRPVQVTTAHGKTIRTSYDGLKTTVDDGSKQITTTQNAIGKTISQSDPGGTIKYTYFGNGALKTANYEGVEQKITQDGWGRKTSLTDPAAGVYRYAYDSWGRLTEETTPKGKTTLTYEPNSDRIKSKHLVGDHTDMLIRYTYNAEKLLTQIDNENQDGNSDHYTYTYDHNRQLLTSSETNPWAKYTKAYTYDLFGRVQKEMTTAEAAGKRASAMVQYRYQNGELVEMKNDKGVTLWKLSSENPYGQPLISHKGGIKETYTYDKGYPVSQLLQNEDKAIGALTWQFNPQKGLLDSRQYSFWGKQEDFSYDNLDRLTAWGDANTPPQTHSYDERGRITENSLLGTYKYPAKGYDQEKLVLNSTGEAFYKEAPMPVIRYNMLKSPEQIYVKGKERITYLYNALGSRAHSFYGNAEAEKEKRPIHKHYSADGSVEIKEDKTKGSIDFLFYLGGDPYSAPAVYSSNGEEGKLLFLHRDQLGSIIAITDLNGKLVEARHFDAWGKVLSITDGNGNKLDKLLLDRGYTGHEHLTSVGLIHMNGRLYDPALHRFLMPDNYIQDPFNTQNFNRYGYCLNNPLVYVDQDGEFFWIPVIIGAAVGAYTGGTIANNGEANPIKWNYSVDTFAHILSGVVIGALSGYVGGAIATSQIPMANTLGIAGGSIVNSLGTYVYTEGKTDISISFGAASYNFTQGSFGYLGKKGNSFLENVGYGLGALANLADINLLFNSTPATLYTDDTDFISHSAIVDENENTLMSFGPNDTKVPSTKIGYATYFRKSTSDYHFESSLPVDITVNKYAIYAVRGLGKALPFQGITLNCVNMASLSLWLNGIPNIGLHPYLLYATTLAYSSGIRPDLLSYYLTNPYKRK
ncbi:sugar-binding protein [Capnocytophaga genosp. AHN8471]|uniref:RHS repeat-associated core domain-containing protein n=1 Tax=Capnocytophaga genosp. AHN8471 TaxID=327574 RepID=UPI0019332BA6|nr:RHS repeat-associated core domain-containing protein [Capnocytophaga genosp. AHN8471]MBM0654727.1 sugar-binding protein [Capnocytophaga genosp. AHN8471]